MHDALPALLKPWRNLGEPVGSVETVGQGWEIRLCGPVVVESEGRRLDSGLPGRQGRLLFAYLVMNRARGCPRDELIDVLWPEGPPAAAGDLALSASARPKLRRALGEGVLMGRGELRVHFKGVVTVIEASAAAIAQSEAALEAGDPALAAAKARAALETDLQTFLPDRRRRLGGRSSGAKLEKIHPRRAGDARPRPGCARAPELAGEQAARAAIAAAPSREVGAPAAHGGARGRGNPAEALRVFDVSRADVRYLYLHHGLSTCIASSNQRT